MIKKIILLIQILILGISMMAVEIPFKTTRISKKVLVMGANNNSRTVILNTQKGLVFIDCFWSPAIVKEALKIIEKDFEKNKI